MKVFIPYNIPDIKEPKIPGTNIPNIFGRAVITYGNGMKKYVDLYYLQKGIRTVAKVLLFPLRKVRHMFLKKRCEKYAGRYFKREER